MRGTRHRGELGEDYACQLLQEKGYTILTKNFISRWGEIDIIAVDPQKTLVFAEVKTRWGTKYGKPEEAVTPQKLAKIIKTADYWCMQKKLKSVKKRVDVVSILLSAGEVVSAKIIKVT